MAEPTEQEVIEQQLGLPVVEEEEHHEETFPGEEETAFREWAGLKEGEQLKSPSMSKRFRALYRETQDAKRNAAEKDEDNRLMREHMKKIMGSVEKVTEATGKLAESKEEERAAAIQGEIQGIQQGIKDLKAEMDDAIEAGEVKKAFKLRDAIDDQKEALKAKRAEAERKSEKKETRTDSGSLAADVIEEQKAVNKWAKDTPWFNAENDDYDPAMVIAAREMDAAFQVLDKWKGKSAIDRVKAVQERIEKKFGYAGKGKKNGNGSDETFGLEGVDGERGKGKDGEMVLSAEEKRQAHLFFDDLTGPGKAEAYFMQQLKETGARR
jgi:hypothetical protein